MDLLSLLIFLLIEYIGIAVGYYTPLAGLFVSIVLIGKLGFNDYVYFFIIGLGLGAALKEAYESSDRDKNKRC